MRKDTITTIAEVLGAVLIVAGVAMLYVPAAFVAAGISLFGLSWATNR